MKKNKTLKNIAIISSLFAATQASAEISANVALTTDYVWRGISQNEEDLALQGGFDFSHENGFYIGTWGSNVSFGNSSTELDLYLGWANEFESGFGLDVGVIEYTYHGGNDASDNNFTEFYLGGSYGGFSAMYSVGDEFDDHFDIGYEHSFEKVTLSATYGDYDSYSYYKVGISGEVGGMGLALDIWDTDSTAERLAGGLAGSRVVFTLSKSF